MSNVVWASGSAFHLRPDKSPHRREGRRSPAGQVVRSRDGIEDTSGYDPSLRRL